MVLCLTLLSPPAGAQEKSDKNPPDIGKCLSFLEQHPDSPEADAVSDTVCRYLLDGLGPNASQKDFDEAARFARSEEMKALVRERKRECKKALAAKQRYLRARERWSFGLGAYASAWNNNEMELFLTTKIGGEHVPLNGFISLGFSYWNLFLPKAADKTFSDNLFIVSAGCRFNVGWQSLFVDTAISFNLPTKLLRPTNLYKTYNDITDDPLQFNYSLSLCLGRRFGNIDWRIGAVYDLKPIYKQQMIYETPFFDYYSIRPILNERWRVSVSAIIYFKR